MVRNLLRNPVYRKYLWMKAPASVAFEVPNQMIAYYVQYCAMDSNPALVQGNVTLLVVFGALLIIPIAVIPMQVTMLLVLLLVLLLALLLTLLVLTRSLSL